MLQDGEAMLGCGEASGSGEATTSPGKAATSPGEAATSPIGGRSAMLDTWRLVGLYSAVLKGTGRLEAASLSVRRRPRAMGGDPGSMLVAMPPT